MDTYRKLITMGWGMGCSLCTDLHAQGSRETGGFRTLCQGFLSSLCFWMKHLQNLQGQASEGAQQGSDLLKGCMFCPTQRHPSLSMAGCRSDGRGMTCAGGSGDTTA